MTPELQARHQIDRQLEACGWVVQDRKAMNIYAALGVAIREFPLDVGEADYLLYADGKVIGVVEAKPAEHGTLTGVESQSAKYVTSLPSGVPSHKLPVPFHYETTGTVTQFTNLLDPSPRSRMVFAFHRPEELLRQVALDRQLRQVLAEMPPLEDPKLWRVQAQAISNLEKSLAQNRPRSLVQMATGSGKTFTSISAIYRLIKHAGAKRVLFLVDRTNLGKQTYREFQQYVSPANGYKFTDEFNVQHLKKNTIDPVSRVCITTVQRLYSMLRGEADFDEANEESSMYESVASLVKEAVPVEYNPQIPIESFDFIVADECHRSIYNLWRQVLDYFDAFLIGLTATPTKQTIGFFSNNLVMEYGHEQAVADGVNVGFDVYRIRTKITEQGAALEKEQGRFIPRRDRRTRAKRYAELDDDLIYNGSQLDRDVVSPEQIRLVVRTFRDRLFTEIFPGRTEVPKTLIFAKDDSHAEDITRIVREEFGKGNDFCQKITYRTTGKKPEELLAEFRNSFNPRIAVSVDMIATGTDVKPLECLLFMRMVKSAGYFEQMKGRGCRVVSPDELQSVTPDAKTKTHFVIVDAVGVCEQDKGESKPLDRQPTVPLDKILDTVAKGVADPDLASTLAARLTRLDRQLTDEQRAELSGLANGQSVQHLAVSLLTAINADAQVERAAEKFQLAEGQEPTEKQLEQVQEELLRQALKPFHDPKLRDRLANVRRSLDQIIDEVTQDELLHAGFSASAMEKAQALVTNFKAFIEANKDELEAIRVFYSRPQRLGLRFKHVKELAEALKRPPLSSSPERVWSAFQAVEPNAVKGQCGKLVDVIALVKHAVQPDTPLVPFTQTVDERFQQWLADQRAAGVTFTAEQLKKWFKIKEQQRAGERTDYQKTDLTPRIAAEAEALLGDHKAAFDGLLALFNTLDSTEAELLATVYAAWNDLLLDGRPADEAAITAEVYGWHPSKREKFTPEAITTQIAWMRANGYSPTGTGQRTTVPDPNPKPPSSRKKPSR
jgi:type I restriction enzyme R subunit